MLSRRPLAPWCFIGLFLGDLYKVPTLTSITRHMRLEMKPKQAVRVLLSRYCSLHLKLTKSSMRRPRVFAQLLTTGSKTIFELITRLGLSTPFSGGRARRIYLLSIRKKNEILANAAAFPVRSRRPLGTCERSGQGAGWKKQAGLLLSRGVYGFKPFTNQYYYASFPSGHANTIAALCYGLGVVTRRFKLILLSIALVVMASRVIVGAHFPSDVLFGAYLGVVVTELVAVGFEKKGLVIRRKPEKAPPQPVEKTDAL